MSNRSSSKKSEAISTRNSTKESAAKNRHRKASLFMHPHGLKLLKFYRGLKKGGVGEEEKNKTLAGKIAKTLEKEKNEKLASNIANALAGASTKGETGLSSALCAVLKESWAEIRNGEEGASTLENGRKFSVGGEKEESVQGEVDGEYCTGNPDVVIRNAGKAAAVFELSVEGNGGEKKLHQAYEYARLVEQPNDVIILFALHVKRADETSGSEKGESNAGLPGCLDDSPRHR